VHAASGQPPESGPESTSKSVRSTLDAFYRFSRPHTVTGTVKSKFVVQIQQRFNDHCISLPASKNFVNLILFFALSMWKKERFIFTFLRTGFEHLISFSPCNREAPRYFSTIFHRGAGGNARLFQVDLKSSLIGSDNHNHHHPLFICYFGVAGCGRCSHDEYLYCGLKSVDWHRNRQGSFA